MGDAAGTDAARPGALRIRLKKGRDGPAALTCCRTDGTSTWRRMHPFFPLHDLLHYAVETTLVFREGFFGLVAAGWDLEDFERPGAAGRLPDETLWAETIVGVFDQERAAGVRWTAEDFNAGVSLALTRQGRPPFRPVTGAELDAIRGLHAELGARWMGTAAGDTLELPFPPDEAEN